MIKWLLAVLGLTIGSAQALEIFHCTHPQVCNLARKLAKDSASFRMIQGLEGLNPHHSSPSVAIYKKFKKAEGILFAPLEIEPWFKGYENKHKKSFRINVESKYSHFWLHPNALCEAEKLLRSHFMQFNLKLIEPSNGYCQKTLQKSPQPRLVVLTHESLLPLMQESGHEVFVLNTHDEHHDLSPKTLKSLTDKIKSKKEVSWVIETQFHHPHAIKKMIKENHKKLEINSIGINGESPDRVLNDILNFMEAK